jgi:hypothetical protein
MIGSDELLATAQHVRLESSAFLGLLCRRSLCRSLSCGLLGNRFLRCRLLGGGLLAARQRLSLRFSRLSSCCSAQNIPHSARSRRGGWRGS